MTNVCTGGLKQDTKNYVCFPARYPINFFTLLALIQHFLDYFHGLDLELDVFDHTLFHHDLRVNHAFHQRFFLIVVEGIPHFHHEHVLLLHHAHTRLHPMFMHLLFNSCSCPVSRIDVPFLWMRNIILAIVSKICNIEKNQSQIKNELKKIDAGNFSSRR
jgi:hypothetical protein